MKASLSNRIYLNCDEGSDLDKLLLSELIHEISQEPISPYPLVIKNIIRISKKIVTIPSGRLDLIPSHYEIVDRRVDADVVIPKPKFTPRDSQQECIDHFEGNGLINAPVGWGKSIAGLGLAYKFQKKTLIITTTTTIRDMWISEIKKWFGFDPGVIGGGKFNIDPPIVVGNIQTVRNRTDKLANEFGLVIIDEVHRAPAKTFTDTLDSLRAKIKIGLSGTMVRKDGMHVVLKDYFGDDIFHGVVENVINPEIHLYDSQYELSANEFIPWARKINDLMGSDLYKNQILFLADTYRSMGKKVLILADRTAFLEELHLRMPDHSLLITGKITGSEKRQSIMDLVAKHEEGICLFATQSIFSEGVSLNELCTVILATPINNEPLLLQIIGRVMRQAKNKFESIVVDVGLSGTTGKRHRNNRVKTYLEKGWRIKNLGRI